MFDLIIRNGTIVDGTGRAAFIGDIAVRSGLLAQVGGTVAGEALREIVNALPDAGRVDVIPNGGFNGNYCLALVQRGEPK